MKAGNLRCKAIGQSAATRPQSRYRKVESENTVITPPYILDSPPATNE